MLGGGREATRRSAIERVRDARYRRWRTRRMLVVSATTTRVFGWMRRKDVPPTTLPVCPAATPKGLG
jgi:hypothetical protein